MLMIQMSQQPLPTILCSTQTVQCLPFYTVNNISIIPIQLTKSFNGAEKQ